jgi:hypothetical protein
VFEGQVNFRGANITRQFQAFQAQFKDKEKEASFDGMKVGQDAFFEKAVFEGPVNFVLADIATNFQGEGAKFKNKRKEAIFSGMKVGHQAFFYDVVFEGPVDFRYADFGLLALSSPSSPKVAPQIRPAGNELQIH